MADNFTVTGADDFLRLSKALKATGRTGLRNDLNKAMKAAAKPMIADVRQAFRDELPARGQLGAFMAKKRTTIVTRTGRDPGVGVSVAKTDPRLESEGRLAHPVFNRRRANGKRVYVVQRIQPGLVGRQVEESAPDVRGALERALEDMAERIIREVG